MGTLLDLATASLTAMTPEQRLQAALSKYLCEHIMYPPFLERKNTLPDLNWKSVPFCAASRASIPKFRGVYAFAVALNDRKLPNNSHILYVGKAGDVASDNTLWRRYYDYMVTERKNDRPRIHEMLQQWQGHLVYHYAIIDESLGTAEIERTLLDILVPPYNRGDFSPELASLLKGANIL